MSTHLSRVACCAIALVVAACGGGGDSTGTTPTSPGSHDTTTTPTNPVPLTVVPKAPPAVSVQGNHLVDASGATIRFRGVNRSGTEFMCVQGRGIFDGPSDDASVRTIASWNVNIVRVPLNEACWLGIDGLDAAYSGANYQKAIADYVALLNHYGIVAILEPHWTAPGTVLPDKQSPMPNRDHTIDFWRGVATAYKDNASVIFDLFNEPYPDNNSNSAEAWRCWKDGGTCNGIGFQVAGFQELVTTVRATGAKNVIMIGGVAYSSRLSGWLANMPADPLNQLAASWHIYAFSQCNTKACWDADADPVSKQVPLILDELGRDSNLSTPLADGITFVNTLMDWMDAHQGSYLAWTWDTWGDAHSLITNYDGTPTAYGLNFRNRFLRAQ